MSIKKQYYKQLKQFLKEAYKSGRIEEFRIEVEHPASFSPHLQKKGRTTVTINIKPAE